MTALSTVQTKLSQSVTAVADVTTGLGGILLAPFASNRTVADAVTSEVDGVINAFFDLGVIPPVVTLYLLWSGGSEESVWLRAGKGTFLGFVTWVALAITGVKF
jgi:hypothetical protein